MAVKIVFIDYKNLDLEKLKHDGNDYYILTGDNWDDSGYKTTFTVTIIKNNEVYTRINRKVLFENQNELYASSDQFNKFHQENNMVNLQEFYLDKENRYISLGHDYDHLKKIFPEEFETILLYLNDIVYLQNKDDQNSLIKLMETEGFNNSLCRDQSAKKLLSEAKTILFTVQLKPDRFKFDFCFNLRNREYKYNFNFMDDNLPHRINVLIGKNGSGKSQTLQLLSEYFVDQKHAKEELGIKCVGDTSFIDNTIVCVYNPYEDFIPYSPDKKDYKYIGFRRLKKISDGINIELLTPIKNGFEIFNFVHKEYAIDIKDMLNLTEKEQLRRTSLFVKKISDENREWEQQSISQTISLYVNTINTVYFDVNLPQQITFDSIKSIYDKDKENFENHIWIYKIPIINKVLFYIRKAIEDAKYICLSLKTDIDDAKYQFEIENIKYDNRKIIIKDIDETEVLPYLDFNDFEPQVFFLDNDFEIIPLSSGQMTFSALVINLLSMIKKNSLILVDEPENTLHPKLEIEFMKILESILYDKDYESFAIIATHSATIAREVPSDFVKIITLNSENQPEIQKPVLNTFGADITRINNYVFDDLFVEEKSYASWLEKLIKQYKVDILTRENDFEKFKNDFKNMLNYEMLLLAGQIWNKYDQA